jgi:hypothetical protein
MKAAGRHHLARAVGVLVAGVAVTWAGRLGYGYYQACALVERLLVAETGRVPGIIKELGPHRRWVDDVLRGAAEDLSRPDRERLHARLALLSTGAVTPESLVDPLLSASPEEFRVILGLLSPDRKRLAPLLWPVATSAGEGPERRLRAACALAAFDRDEDAWRGIAPAVAELLLAENPLLINQWVDLLRPVRALLAGPLADASDALSERGARRLATSILADYCGDDPGRLVDLIVNADPEQFAVLLPKVMDHDEATIPLLQDRSLGRGLKTRRNHGLDPSEQEADTIARQRATAAVALLRLGLPDAVWPLLVNAPDPRLQSEAINALAHLGAEPDRLAERLRGEPDASARMALWLALADCVERAPGASWAGSVIPGAFEAYRTDPDPGVHSAARLFLGRAGESRAVRQIDDELEGRAPPAGRRWFVDGGLTFVSIDPTGQNPFLSTNRSIGRVFAMATTEVTLGQFLQFRPDHNHNRALGTDPELPAGVISWYQAAAFCRWLDERTGVPEDQRCYPPIDQIKEGMRMPPGYLSRTGHRLATFAEWEFAARALASTTRHYGERVGLMRQYAWCSENSGGRLHPVVSLKPNRFGLYDMHGSLIEWCQESIEFLQAPSPSDGEDMLPVTGNRERILRSGGYNSGEARLVCYYLGPLSPMTIWDNVGIRVVRTIRPVR